MITGLAGSGKTELLHILADNGRQVLDLEMLASHRGSAFGGIGMPPQPSHDEFGRMVEARIAAADPHRVLWVEDEGPFIGSVGVPPGLQRAIAAAPVVELHTRRRARIKRLAAIYGDADPAKLLALIRSHRRLGPRLTERAADLLQRGDVRGAIESVLPWYDAAYNRRTLAYRRCVLHRVDSKTSSQLRRLIRRLPSR